MTETGELVAQKVKKPNKEMRCIGHFNEANLFGQSIFPAGGKYITITEGEEDALATYEMLKTRSTGNIEPAVVSIKSGASSAKRDCQHSWEYLNSFETIVLCFDNDEPGQKAAKEVADLFPNKVKIVKMDLKDANEYLKAGRATDFMTAWRMSEKHTPQGIIPSSSLWKDMVEEDKSFTIPYPWKGLQDKLQGMRTGELVVWKASPKVGKCFGKDTPIRMFDGSVKLVQDIVKGDILMGDESTPRTVQSTVNGKDDLYLISQNKGMDYVVNSEHILCLKSTDTKDEITVSLKDYLGMSNQIRWKGYTKPILRNEPFDFKGIDPYILGIWLGDGSTGFPQITNKDPEIVKAFKEYGESVGLEMTYQHPIRYWLKTRATRNVFSKGLRELGILNSKAIPKNIILAPKEDRLSLLAGLLDSDGYLSTTNNNSQSFEITQKNRELARGVLDLARSLGFRASLKQTEKACTYLGEKRTGVYFRITISGKIEEIPTKVERKKARARDEIERRRDPSITGISVEPVGYGEYFGFVLDGNRKFLLEDGTVAHNTQCFRELTYHIHKTTNETVGLIYLEETKKKIGMGLCALEMNKPIQFPDCQYTLEELKDAYDTILGSDRFFIFDPQSERNAKNVFNKIMHFVKAYNCRYIFLDHVSMLAYDEVSLDERKFLDKLFKDLKDLTTSLDIHISAVTHVNDEGKTRGSRAAYQLCDALVDLSRDKLNEDLVIANTTILTVEENRVTGDSGVATKLHFNRDTGRLVELDEKLTVQSKLKDVKFDS